MVKGAGNEDLPKSLKFAMIDQDGEAVRKKAAEMRKPVSNQDLHDACISKFIKHLENLEEKATWMSSGEAVDV